MKQSKKTCPTSSFFFQPSYFSLSLHDRNFLRRQAVEGVNLLVDLALQGARVGGGVQAEARSASKGVSFLNWLTPMMLNPMT